MLDEGKSILFYILSYFFHHQTINPIQSVRMDSLSFDYMLWLVGDCTYFCPPVRVKQHLNQNLKTVVFPLIFFKSSDPLPTVNECETKVMDPLQTGTVQWCVSTLTNSDILPNARGRDAWRLCNISVAEHPVYAAFVYLPTAPRLCCIYCKADRGFITLGTLACKHK